MKKNNPVHQPGVIEKIKQTKLKNGTVFFNNYKYGNGKISKYEKIVYDFLIENGFYYNYAINTRDVRNAFLNKQYAKSYKPDFVNLQRKICIEIDGKNHQKKEIIKLDIKKEECLLFLGYKTIRYTHDFIEKNFNQFKLEVLNLCGLEN